MTWWNFPSVLDSGDLEMMSAACIPVVGIIKKGGVSFQSLFFFCKVTTHSFGIQRRSAEFLRFKLEVRWRIWSLDSNPCSFQASIPSQYSYAKFPVLPCIKYYNFPFVKIAFQHIIYSSLKKQQLFVWLVFIFQKYCVIWEHSHTPWQ